MVEAGGPTQVSTTLNRDYLRDGEYTLVVPISDHIALLMARVVIAWGAFEVRMDWVIEAFLKGLHRQEEKKWRGLPFGRRKKIFAEAASAYTAIMFPNETEFFTRLVATATDLQWQRNTVAHGYIKGQSISDANSPSGFRAQFYAVGMRGNGEEFIYLDEPTLEKMYHEIAHLGGNLIAALGRMGAHVETESPEIVVADRDLLQSPAHGSFQALPISKSPRPPASE